MKSWNTSIKLSHDKGEITIPDVKINKGIFQGDSLSPLLFCLTIDPLSKLLNEKANKLKGYNLSKEGRKKPEENSINHLLFMDDLKLFAENDESLRELLQIVEDYSKDIKMTFGDIYIGSSANITIYQLRRKYGNMNQQKSVEIKM